MDCFGPKVSALLLAALLVTSDVLAHRGSSHRHARIGVVIGSPWAVPWSYSDYYFPYTYTYSSPPVVVLPSPPIYIEQSTAPQVNGQQEGYWWHYCQSARAYYPYITECPQGWQRVPPQPPDLR